MHSLGEKFWRIIIKSLQRVWTCQRQYDSQAIVCHCEERGMSDEAIQCLE